MRANVARTPSRVQATPGPAHASTPAATPVTPERRGGVSPNRRDVKPNADQSVAVIVSETIDAQRRSLDRLLEEPGALLACTFDAGGVLREYKTQLNISREVAASLAQFCGTVCHMFSTLGSAYNKTIPLLCAPHRGSIYRGGDWAVAVAEGRAVFALASQADLNRLLRAVEAAS